MGTIFISALILGITSSFHCLGMCGPIAMAVPVNRTSGWTILGGILQYNFGRVLTYAILGIAAGSMGLTIQTFGVLQWMSIISGIFLIVFAWRKWIAVYFTSAFGGIVGQKYISKNLGKILKSNLPFKPFLLGILNGFLPCGMVYVALMNALLAGNPLSSAYAMIIFGTGTLPAMMVVGFTANRINSGMRRKMNKLVPYLLTMVGLLIVLRGMNLDIPYLSPKVSINTTDEGEEKATMSCCHAGTTCEE